MKVLKSKATNLTGLSHKWIRCKGENLRACIDHIEKGEKGEVWFVKIEDILPSRYASANRGQCKSNNIIQIPTGSTEFYIAESVTNFNTGRTDFALRRGHEESDANTQAGGGYYETDKFVIDADGNIELQG